MTGDPPDPTGKRSLFEAVAGAPAGPQPRAQNDGKAALFSAPPRRPGTVVIDCSGCRARSRASLADLGVRFVSGSAWLPFLRHPHWIRCPSCGRRQWCRVGWME